LHDGPKLPKVADSFRVNGQAKRRADDVHQASTVAHTPGDPRHTRRPTIRGISSRSLPSLDRVAPPLAARARLVVVETPRIAVPTWEEEPFADSVGEHVLTHVTTYGIE
jgi:hypothetical protein